MAHDTRGADPEVQDEDRRKAREAGCDSHFTKPLSPSILNELLGNLAARDLEGSRSGYKPRTRVTDTGGVL